MEEEDPSEVIPRWTTEATVQVMIRCNTLFIHMKRHIFTILLAFVTFIAKAQTASNPGWLWKISGNGLAQNSYLFGTCHGDGISFTDEEIYSIHGLSEALDEAQTVFFESDPNVDSMSDEEKEG